MKYQINDLARILGCTTEAVRYFEKENLIAVKKEPNGHRYYDVIDVFRLLSYTKYRAMEMPIKDIKAHFIGDEKDWRKILQRHEIYRDYALKRLDYYKNLADAMDHHIKSIQDIPRLLHQYELSVSPRIHYLYDNECGWLSKDKESQGVIAEWVRGMPHVQLGVFEQSMNFSPFGYIVHEEDLQRIHLPQSAHYGVIPSTSCLHSIVIAEEDFAENPQKVFEGPLEHLRSKGLAPGALAWGKILLVEVEPPARLHPYVELWISIRGFL